MNVPETLVTTDAKEVMQFWEKHGRIVYKSVSGIRSIVSQLKPNQTDRLGAISACPTQFQEYIEGIDYRVHVIGEQSFACEIVSEADDYRYGSRQGHSLAIKSCTLPDEISELCRGLAAFLRFPVAGVDLRQTPIGKWYCFEVNPSPGFSFYQLATNQPVSDAIAELLIQK